MSRVCKVVLLAGFLVGLAAGCGDKNPKIGGAGTAPTMKMMNPEAGGVKKPQGQ